MSPGRQDLSMMASDRERRTSVPPGRASLRRVFVQRLELMASVGVFEIEKRYEQRVLISVELDVADRYDGHSDRLEDVFDYGRIVDAANAIVASRHFNLIETLAERIAEACLLESDVRWVRVMIEKPDIVAGCASVGIALERSRRS